VEAVSLPSVNRTGEISQAIRGKFPGDSISALRRGGEAHAFAPQCQRMRHRVTPEEAEEGFFNEPLVIHSDVQHSKRAEVSKSETGTAHDFVAPSGFDDRGSRDSGEQAGRALPISLEGYSGGKN
jgi:hypothetical protein